jgi:hypothetical protein
MHFLGPSCIADNEFWRNQRNQTVNRHTSERAICRCSATGRRKELHQKILGRSCFLCSSLSTIPEPAFANKYLLLTDHQTTPPSSPHLRSASHNPSPGEHSLKGTPCFQILLAGEDRRASHSSTRGRHILIQCMLVMHLRGRCSAHLSMPVDPLVMTLMMP